MPVTYSHDFPGLAVPPRSDGIPWTILHPREATTDLGPWTTLGAITLTPDPTPSRPSAIDVEVNDSNLERGYFSFQFETAGGHLSEWLPAEFRPFEPAEADDYASIDQLRDALDNASISDETAQRVIRNASTIIDRLVGSIPVDPVSGRKLRAIGLLAWQRDKLAEATVTIGAVLFTSPNAFRPSGASLIVGPDFRTQYHAQAATVSPAAAYALRSATALLDDARLRRIGARMVPSRRDRHTYT